MWHTTPKHGNTESLSSNRHGLDSHWTSRVLCPGEGGGGMKSKEHWNITVQHSPQFFCNIYLECQNFHYNMARGTSNKPENSDADFMSFNKKHKNPVFFHCFYFITKNKSFINASTCNLKAVIIVMNYLPCGFRCAGAAWRFDLVRLCWHSADGKFYLGKRRKYANDSGKDKLCILWFNNIGLFLEKQQDYSPLCFRGNSIIKDNNIIKISAKLFTVYTFNYFAILTLLRGSNPGPALYFENFYV